MKKLIMIAISLISANALAVGGEGVVFSPSVSYRSEAVKQPGGSESESTEIIFNFKLGYKMSSNLYVGGVYDLETDDVGLASTDGDRKSYGASIGYISDGGFNIFGSYLLNSTNNIGSSKYTGTGIIVDLGYTFQVGSWGIGPVLSYRKFSYDELNGASLSSNYEETLVLPMIQFMFMF